MANKREEEYIATAKEAPRMTALSDHPISSEDAWIDRFNFPFQLGAIYDIIRHSETKTPLTIGIYGDWGTGKTSAMKWLEGLLTIWNSQKKYTSGVKVIPVWFYPWKYHSREEVWRGVVAEVLLATINVKEASPERVLFAVKRFGAFLGRSFVRALCSVKLKTKDPTGILAEGEITFQAVEKILDDFQELNHPEHGYLNKFESMLEHWVKESLGDDERLVIFVDDLDRCLPDVTLEVLEAIKLYLNIKGLIFIVGLDKAVVESIVLQHYAKRGVREDKGKDYLAKMFQIDVHLFRMQQAVEKFIDDQLNTFDIWNTEIPEEKRKLFLNYFSRYAGDSPREVKRVINAAMIAARGWTTFDLGDKQERLKFGEGLQRHFVRLRLRDLRSEAVLSTDKGNDFLSQWSADLFDSGLYFSLELYEHRSGNPVEEKLSPSILSLDRSELPDQYKELLHTFPEYKDLMKDYLLGRLLSVYRFRTSRQVIIQESQVLEEFKRTLKHVVISCSHDDWGEAEKLQRDLITAGINIWVDKKNILPGQDWKLELRKAFQSSYAIILCFSKKSVQRSKAGIFLEVTDAIAAYQQFPESMLLIPVRLSECDIPQIEINETTTLDQLQFVDLFPSGKREQGIERLIAGLERMAPGYT